MTDTSEEAARRRAAEQLSAATAAMVTQGNIEAERAEQEKKAKKEAKRKVSLGYVVHMSSNGAGMSRLHSPLSTLGGGAEASLMRCVVSDHSGCTSPAVL